MKKIILISGITGFLGSNLFRFLKEDFTIYGIGSNAENFEGIEVFSSNNIDEISIVPDFIILCHAAISSGQTSQSIELLFNVNVSITDTITKKFINSNIIYISTASIYDSNCSLINEKTINNPTTDYAVSKFWAEKLVSKRLNSVIFRLSSLYGKGMKENTIIPNYVNQAFKNGVVEVWGKGEREQNYIHVDDACGFIYAALNNFDSINGKLLLAVSEKEFSNNELAQVICSITNSKIKYINSDNSKSLNYNNDFTCELLSWNPKSNLIEEIKKYIEWKKEQY